MGCSQAKETVCTTTCIALIHKGNKFDTMTSSDKCFILWKSGNLASRRNAQNMAIPLCLPNNFQWSSATGKYFKTGERHSSLYVVNEALQKLRTVRGKIFFKLSLSTNFRFFVCGCIEKVLYSGHLIGCRKSGKLCGNFKQYYAEVSDDYTEKTPNYAEICKIN